jgi:hypothetical protein
MTRANKLFVTVGLLALAGAVWEFAAGSGWSGFWLALLGLGFAGRATVRRYWERRAANDPAVPALVASWWFAVMACVGIGLGVSQLAGIGLREDTGRGIAGLGGGFFCAYWSAHAARDRRRLRDATSAATS